MIFTNILLNKFLDFSNEETIHLANAIEVNFNIRNALFENCY